MKPWINTPLINRDSMGTIGMAMGLRKAFNSMSSRKIMRTRNQRKSLYHLDT
jgi:hypothetical protein